MEAKPPKFAMKRFNDYKNELFEQIHQDTTYSPFDPKRTIARQPMSYIFNDTADKAARDAETRLRAAQHEAES